MKEVTSFYVLDKCPSYFIELIRNEYVSEEFARWLIKEGFFEAPASTKYHLNKKGGLYKHSQNVTEALVTLTKNNNLEWQNERSPYIVGMFHDLCKIDQYVINIDNEYIWNDKQLIKGHGDKSVMLLSQHMQLTEEEVLCIRYHMGAYQTDDWDEFDRAIRKYPNVLWTHTADMIASKLVEG